MKTRSIALSLKSFVLLKAERPGHLRIICSGEMGIDCYRTISYAV